MYCDPPADNVLIPAGSRFLSEFGNLRGGPLFHGATINTILGVLEDLCNATAFPQHSAEEYSALLDNSLCVDVVLEDQ
jgi:hypothetical protein